MNGTMLAARAHEGETRFRLEQVAIPTLGAQDVLVRVGASGITRGLVSLWQRRGRIKLLPATLGHEIAGTVVEVGDEVTTASTGDRVRVHAPLTPAGDLYAARDREMLSTSLAMIGHAIYGDAAMPLYERYHNGGLAEYVKVPAGNIDLLPESVPFDVGSRVHSLGISWRTLRKADLDHGSTVVVTGATGASGASTVVCAPHWGATKVIAVSRNRASLDRVAALLPAGMVESVAIEELPDDWAETGVLRERLRELSGGRGPDAVVDFLPGMPEITRQSIYSMAKGGRAILAGGNRSELRFVYGDFVPTNWELKGSNGLTRRDTAEVMALLQAGQLQLTDLITHRFPLTAVNDAVDAVENRVGNPMHVVVEPAA